MAFAETKKNTQGGSFSCRFYWKVLSSLNNIYFCANDDALSRNVSLHVYSKPTVVVVLLSNVARWTRLPNKGLFPGFCLYSMEGSVWKSARSRLHTTRSCMRSYTRVSNDVVVTCEFRGVHTWGREGGYGNVHFTRFSKNTIRKSV